MIINSSKDGVIYKKSKYVQSDDMAEWSKALD